MIVAQAALASAVVGAFQRQILSASGSNDRVYVFSVTFDLKIIVSRKKCL